MWKIGRGFTLIEILLASSLAVIVSAAIYLGMDALTDYRFIALTKERLTMQAYTALNDIESAIEKKLPSLGNLFINEVAYPMQYKKNYPRDGDSFFSFIIGTDSGPATVAFICTDLPDVLQSMQKNTQAGAGAACRGLYYIKKSASETENILSKVNSTRDLSSNFSVSECNVLNLLSEDVVAIDVQFVSIPNKYEQLEISDGMDEKDIQSLRDQHRCRYTDIGIDQDMFIYSGEITYGSDAVSLEHIDLMDIGISCLSSRDHCTYFSLTSSEDKKNLLRKRGVYLSRFIPWRI